MKKTVTLGLFAIGALFTTKAVAQEQLTNSGFENWYNTPIKDSINNWFGIPGAFYPLENNISRIDDGFSGDAVRMENVLDNDDLPASAAILLASDFSFEEVIGYPYSSAVETINAQLRYSFEPNDTGYVLVILEVGGFPFSASLFPIYGESATWTLSSWDLVDPILTPDKVTVGFFSSGYNGTEPVVGSWLEVDHVSFGNDGPTPAALPNFSFENWTEVEIEQSENWSSFDQVFSSALGFSNISKSTDASEGDYSLKMSTLDENVEYDVIPYLTNGIFDFELGEMMGGSEFTGNPLAFKGDYKFESTPLDLVNLTLIIWSEEAVFSDELELEVSADWTSFSIPIELEFIPDSVLVMFEGGEEAGADFYLDNIRFIYEDVSVAENANIQFKLYPNPTTSLVNIQTNEKIETIQIFNSIGELVQVENTSTFSVAQLPNGIYFIHLKTSEGVITQRLVKE